MRTAPSATRVHIGIFGRRNVGKSSLINALAGHVVSLVSTEPGTTTDPVKKALELPSLGPAILVDTAGLDDEGILGRARVERTKRVIERTDIGVLVTTGCALSVDIEERLVAELSTRGIPVVIVINKVDVTPLRAFAVERLRRHGAPVIMTSATRHRGIEDLLLCLAGLSLPSPDSSLLVADLIPESGTAVLVVPIDQQAPKGRLVLPQTQAIRELLDHGCTAIATRDDQLAATMAWMRTPPDLVVTDSQAVERVAAITPESVPLTTFSILMARHKGDLALQLNGARVIDRLSPGDRVLIAEACSHHPTEDDIGRVKIPLWLAKKAGGELVCDHVRGRDFPDDLDDYSLVIHCGACTWNRRQVLSRLERCRNAGVPVSNYGMIIAHTNGLLDRAMLPFDRAGGESSRAQRKPSPVEEVQPTRERSTSEDRSHAK